MQSAYVSYMLTYAVAALDARAHIHTDIHYICRVPGRSFTNFTHFTSFTSGKSALWRVRARCFINFTHSTHVTSGKAALRRVRARSRGARASDAGVCVRARVRARVRVRVRMLTDADIANVC